MGRLKEIAATFFYLGYSPVASGTAGTLGAMALAMAILFFEPPIAFGYIAIALALLFLLLGIPLGNWAEQYYGRKDPGPFVLDEVMGYFVTLAFYFSQPPTLGELAVGFFLFRLFDVIKPPPARQLERVAGGLGIMLDDLAAGLYAMAGLVVYHSIRYQPVW